MKNDDITPVLTTIGLPALRVVADQEGIAALEGHPGGKYTFAEALKLALEAFFSNGRGSSEHAHDSAIEMVRSDPESFGLGANPSAADIAEALRSLLAGDPEAQIVLLTDATIKQDAYRFLPEFGESITENWVFRIMAPGAWPFLQWSIVDVRGETPAYSYEFD